METGDDAADYLPTLGREELEELLRQLRKGLRELYGNRLQGLQLFGSYARDEAVPGSDVDVLVVLDELESSWKEIQRTSRLRADLSLAHDVSLNTIWVTERDWKERDTPFLENVREEGLEA